MKDVKGVVVNFIDGKITEYKASYVEFSDKFNALVLTNYKSISNIGREHGKELYIPFTAVRKIDVVDRVESSPPAREITI